MKIINMDHVAASPILPEVADAMIPFLKEKYGNPSSMHSMGEEVTEAIDEAREKVAELINAKPQEIYFTSGGTESNNWALKGGLFANRAKGAHLITSSIEHFSIMHAIKALEKIGVEVTRLPVDKYGFIDPDDVRKAITPATALISVMQRQQRNRDHRANWGNWKDRKRIQHTVSHRCSCYSRRNPGGRPKSQR